MALDLATEPDIELTVADINPHSLEEFASHTNIKTVVADLSDLDQLKILVRPYDLVLDAVPGFLGFQTFKAVIESGKNIVDIAFFPEDPFLLDQLAKEMKLTAIMDMGVAPGMSNLLVGYVNHLLDKTLTVEIYVGGLPVVREKPFEYKAVFSPIDVIEEYTRPARFVRNGKLIEKPALTEPEFFNFYGVGTLEAFNSDGLRSLIQTIDAPDMVEKTLRYPGHRQLMQILQESGFFSLDPVNISGVHIRPIDLTTKLLFPIWKLQKGEEDLTVMKIVVTGMKDGAKVGYSYELFDKYDTSTAVHSMARTTGYAATAAVRLLLSGLYQRKGVIVPEYIGENQECTRFILADLAKKNIFYKESIF